MSDLKESSTENSKQSSIIYCSDIILFNEKRKRIEDGKYLYDTNIFFKKIADVMEDNNFKYIYKNYFDSWENIKLFLMFSKVYDSITQQQPTMEKYEKIHLVKTLIDTSQTRQLICKKIIEFTNNKDRQLLK